MDGTVLNQVDDFLREFNHLSARYGATDALGDKTDVPGNSPVRPPTAYRAGEERLIDPFQRHEPQHLPGTPQRSDGSVKGTAGTDHPFSLPKSPLLREVDSVLATSSGSISEAMSPKHSIFTSGVDVLQSTTVYVPIPASTQNNGKESQQSKQQSPPSRKQWERKQPTKTPLRETTRHYSHREHKAATCIQAAWRGYKTRAAYPPCASVRREIRTRRIENHVRHLSDDLNRCRQQVHEQGNFIKLLYMTLKGVYAELQSEREKREVKAAQLIQKHWRGFVARKTHGKLLKSKLLDTMSHSERVRAAVISGDQRALVDLCLHLQEKVITLNEVVTKMASSGAWGSKPLAAHPQDGHQDLQDAQHRQDLVDTQPQDDAESEKDIIDSVEKTEYGYYNIASALPDLPDLPDFKGSNPGYGFPGTPSYKPAGFDGSPRVTNPFDSPTPILRSTTD